MPPLKLYSFIGIPKTVQTVQSFQVGNLLCISDSDQNAWNQAHQDIPQTFHITLAGTLDPAVLLTQMGYEAKVAQQPTTDIALEASKPNAEVPLPPNTTNRSFDASIDHLAAYMRSKGFVVYKKK